MPDSTPQENLAADQAEPVRMIHLGKDEMNLAEFPITLLTDRVPKGKTVIQYRDEIFDEKTGKKIIRKLTISADNANGLPTAVDDDVIMGLIQLTKKTNAFTSREVEFSRLDLIRTLGWPDSGESYRRLTTSLKRWLSVTLLYENAWRDNRQGAWTTKGFHILDNIELNHSRTISAQGELFPSKIIWNKVVFESFEAGYLKTIDYGLYLTLRHTTAKRMYRFLSKRMYFSPELTFELRDLAFAHIGLSDSYSGNAAKIKEKLQPAIEELESIGFLKPMSKEDRYFKEGKEWHVRFVCHSPFLVQALAAQIPSEASLLAKELITRKVSEKKAEELVKKYPAESILLKLEVFDWLQETKDKRVSKNPAGWLVKSIVDDYATPEGFTSREERLLREAESQQKLQAQSDKRRRAQLDHNRQQGLRQKADERIKQLSPDARAELEARLLAEASPQVREQCANPGLARLRDTLILVMFRDYFEALIDREETQDVPA